MSARATLIFRGTDKAVGTDKANGSLTVGADKARQK